MSALGKYFTMRSLFLCLCFLLNTMNSHLNDITSENNVTYFTEQWLSWVDDNHNNVDTRGPSYSIKCAVRQILSNIIASEVSTQKSELLLSTIECTTTPAEIKIFCACRATAKCDLVRLTNQVT